MKLLRVDIQDGDSQYSEWFKSNSDKKAREIVISIEKSNGFLRAVRGYGISEINSQEIEVLEKFNVI